MMHKSAGVLSALRFICMKLTFAWKGTSKESAEERRQAVLARRGQEEQLGEEVSNVEGHDGVKIARCHRKVAWQELEAGSSGEKCWRGGMSK